jgi:hypothetical protein
MSDSKNYKEVRFGGPKEPSITTGGSRTVPILGGSIGLTIRSIVSLADASLSDVIKELPVTVAPHVIRCSE